MLKLLMERPKALETRSEGHALKQPRPESSSARTDWLPRGCLAFFTNEAASPFVNGNSQPHAMTEDGLLKFPIQRRFSGITAI